MLLPDGAKLTIDLHLYQRGVHSIFHQNLGAIDKLLSLVLSELPTSRSQTIRVIRNYGASGTFCGHRDVLSTSLSPGSEPEVADVPFLVVALPGWVGDHERTASF